MPSTNENTRISSSFLREWAATGLALILSIALVLAASLTNFDVIRLNIKILERIEKYQLDDLLAGFALLFAGVAVDRWFRKKSQQSEMAQERLRVVHATMRTVQDIVNNFLNNIQLFRMEAEGVLPDKTLKGLDDVIDEAATKIRALGNLEVVIEKQMTSGVGIEYPLEPISKS